MRMNLMYFNVSKNTKNLTEKFKSSNIKIELMKKTARENFNAVKQ